MKTFDADAREQQESTEDNMSHRQSIAVIDEAEFKQLTEQWQSEAAFVSSPTAIAMSPAYQRIVGMGERAVPLILRELETEPHHWFWALTSITGVDPVPARDRGQVLKMAEAWIEWGRENGYKW